MTQPTPSSTAFGQWRCLAGVGVTTLLSRGARPDEAELSPALYFEKAIGVDAKMGASNGDVFGQRGAWRSLLIAHPPGGGRLCGAF